MLRTERTFKAIWNALFIIWRLSLKQTKQIFLEGEIPTLILFFEALETGVEKLRIQSFLVNWDWNQWIKYNFEGKMKNSAKNWDISNAFLISYLYGNGMISEIYWQMLYFCSPWKYHQKTLRFSDVFRDLER